MYKIISAILFFSSACDAKKEHEKRVLAIGNVIMKLDTLNPEARMIPDVVNVGDRLVQKVSGTTPCLAHIEKAASYL